MILIIDNYDSFTYNLYQYIGEINPEVEVYRNDRITIKEVGEKKPTHIILSPGPGYPKEAGISVELVRKLGSCVPFLGVCLGHQAIAEAYGGRIVHAQKLVHGKASCIEVDEECSLFYGLPRRIAAGRYHSLIAERKTLPKNLKVTATNESGEVMGLQHKEFPIFGVQFHPESVLTPTGKTILNNFLSIK